MIVIVLVRPVLIPAAALAVAGPVPAITCKTGPNHRENGVESSVFFNLLMLCSSHSLASSSIRRVLVSSAASSATRIAVILFLVLNFSCGYVTLNI